MECEARVDAGAVRAHVHASREVVALLLLQRVELAHVGQVIHGRADGVVGAGSWRAGAINRHMALRAANATRGSIRNSEAIACGCAVEGIVHIVDGTRIGIARAVGLNHGAVPCRQERGGARGHAVAVGSAHVIGGARKAHGRAGAGRVCEAAASACAGAARARGGVAAFSPACTCARFRFKQTQRRKVGRKEWKDGRKMRMEGKERVRRSELGRWYETDTVAQVDG